jgi:hypothetical protein
MKQFVLALLVLALEFVDEVVNETVVEVLTTQVSATGGCLTSKIPSPIKRNIKNFSTKIEDEHVALAVNVPFYSPSCRNHRR